ncbi:MAG: DUF4143 domain-containing protein, partial [Chlamydiia bacterium]|nr:DUF4143 domain-containing protein [Chlamydiia bacterium]
VMDSVQAIIDEGLAQFILTGSSALKLKHGAKLNLLPGRVVSLTMSPLVYEELPSPKPSLDDLLVYGTLPEISLEEDRDNREKDLFSYVSTYLEEEIRAEAAVRNLGFFSRFLELAAGEAGKQVNLSNLSREIGVTHQTISSYFQILDDSLVATRIDPIVNGRTKRRLFKSPKYLFFDLGIRRVAANEGVRLPQSFLGDLFEHYVGNELLNLSALTAPEIKVRYWRDTAGPEVDYVIDWGKEYIPVEVKYSEAPQKRDARHLETFLSEYSEATDGFVICRTPHAYRLSDRVIALPWQELNTLFQRNR